MHRLPSLLLLLLLRMASGQDLQPHEFFIEYRFFANLGGIIQSIDVPLSTMVTAMREHMNEFIAGVAGDENEVVAIQSIDFFNRGACETNEFELEYTNCARVRSNIELITEGSLDTSLVERMLVKEIQTFLEDLYERDNTSVDGVYDYPKWVRAAVFVELTGISDPMNDDEIYMFLRTFEEGFRPRMEADNYDWLGADVILQQESQTPEKKAISDLNDLNRVELYVKATCSGDACNDENFYNYLIVNIQLFATEFLGRLYAVGPPSAKLYFDYILRITVRNQKLSLPDLPQPTAIDTTAAVIEEESEVPFWMWLILLAASMILACAITYVCLFGPRKSKVHDIKQDDNDTVNREDGPEFDLADTKNKAEDDDEDLNGFDDEHGLERDTRI